MLGWRKTIFLTLCLSTVIMENSVNCHGTVMVFYYQISVATLFTSYTNIVFTKGHVMLQSELPAVMDSVEANLLDLFITKFWAMKFASVAACTVLRVDQVSTVILRANIIASRPSRVLLFFFDLFPIWVGASIFQSPRSPVLCFFSVLVSSLSLFL